jgi:predicted permease
LNALLGLFVNNLLPIFLAAGTGYAAAKSLNVAPRPISQIAFYIFSPCLIYSLLTSNQLNGSAFARMAGFTLVSVFLIGLVAYVLGRLLQFDRRLLVAVLLTTMFSNAGNYGLSLNLFAFGDEALAYASVYFVTMAILIYTLGVFMASLGSSSLGEAFLALFKAPVVYAVVLALLFTEFGLTLPLPLDRTVNLLGDAAIPVLMVLMGIQLGHAKWDGKTKALTLTNILRLVVAPAIALGISWFVGLQGAARQAGISESAMPAAVINTVLATEFNVEPSFVSTVVFVSTLLSPITVTPLLAYLGA